MHKYNQLLVHNTTLYVCGSQEFTEPKYVIDNHFQAMVAGQDMVVHSRCFDRKLPYK